MCVESTLRDASDKGFGCVLVEDATGTDAQEYHDNAMPDAAAPLRERRGRPTTSLAHLEARVAAGSAA